jgi:diaminohydroxyphosphoribosylaminopyrimidine deaminase/5-amino-6-(5-phosphoribosylamino)uracil reductase
MAAFSNLSSIPADVDERYMRLALCQARKGLGRTSPNPAVGAVLVRDGEVLSTGWHQRAGGPHAEIEALSALARLEMAAGATLYVTLEPCSTVGRTPPCTDAIIAGKIGRVVIGTIDPNPNHQGRGLERLRRAGITVTTGILEEEAGLLNVGFNKWITTGTPWVIAKVAQSLDGRITRPTGEPPWLSNDKSLRLNQHLRATVDAILVGAETVRQDNPRLTVRTGSRHLQPWRVVVTRSGNLPSDATILTDEYRDRTLIYQRIAWREMFKELGAKGVTRLLVEGGGDVLGQLRDLQLIDEVWCFITPLLTGGNKPSFGGGGVVRIGDATRLHRVRYKRIGNDVLVTGHTLHPGHL